MNIFQKFHIKRLLKKAFKKEFVDTGYVKKDFHIKWDEELKDFCILYTPIKVERFEDDPIIEESEIKEEEYDGEE